MQPLIAVPANDIDPAGMELAVELPRPWLDKNLEDADARAASPGSLRGRLSRSGKADIVVRAHLSAEIEVPCARCLGPARAPVDTEIALLLKPRPGAGPDESGRTRGPRAKARAANAAKASVSARGTSTRTKAHRIAEYEFTGAEADLDEYDGEKVVLDEFVREAILLEIPSFPLCSESCPGGTTEREPGDSPEVEDPAPAKTSPFAALRHLLTGEALPPDAASGNRHPSPADIRRIARAKKRSMPKIRSSAVQTRGKK